MKEVYASKDAARRKLGQATRRAKLRSASPTILPAFLLFWFSTLAASGNSLTLPFVQRDALHETGIAISNTTTTAGQITLTLYDPNGNAATQSTRRLPAGGQIDGTLHDLLGISGDFEGWLRIDGTVEVAALGIFIRTDNGWIASSSVVRAPDIIQYFPHVAVGSGWQTSVAVANTGTVGANVKAVLYDASGNLISTQSVPLPAHGQMLLDVGTLFKIDTILSGHLEIAADQPLATSELFQNVLGIASLSGQRIVAAGANGKWTQVFPYVTSDSNRWTGVAYVNITGAPALVTVELFATDGSIVATKTDFLTGKAQEVYLLSDLAQNWQGAGYLRLTADVQVAGFVLTGSSNASTSSSFTAWSGQNEAGKELQVAHIAEIPGWASDFSLVNLDPVAGSVEIDALDQSGNLLSKSNSVLAANQQMHTALSSLLSLNNQAGGSLKISSTTNVAVANVFAGVGGYAGVQATLPADLAERTVPAMLLASQTVGPAGGDISVTSVASDNPLGSVRLSIPAGALNANTEIQILATLPTLPNPDRHFALRQYPIQLLPSGLQFAGPVRLTIPASPELITTPQQLQSLSALTYNDPTMTWQALPILASDSTSNTVTIQISHFSTYSIEAANVAASISPDDVDKVFGNSTDIASGVKLILNQGDVDPAISSLADAISMEAAAIDVTSDFKNGNYLAASQVAIEFIGKQSGDLACKAGFGIEGPSDQFCELVVSGLYNLGDIAGEALGNLLADWQGSHDGRTLNLQIQRYLAFRQSGYAQGQVPTCSAGWYPDPQNGCGNGDGNLCKLLPGTCNYPDGLTYYTPQTAANAADQLILQDNQIAANLPKLQSAVSAAAQQLISKYGSQQGPSAGFAVSPNAQGPAPFTIGGQATSSSTALTYVWDFGDGTRFQGGPTVSHTYNSPGTYALTLTVQDSQSLKTAQSSRFINVSSAPTSGPVIQSGGPKITTSVTSVNVPGTLMVSGTGFNSGASVQFYWAIQNGPTSSSGNQRAGADGSAAYTIAFPANAAVGQYSVYAQESGGQPSNSVPISVNGGSPAPRADSVSPGQATLDPSGLATAFQVTINGSNFAFGASVRVYYARNNSYGGQFHSAGDLVGIVPSSVIQQGAGQLSVPLKLGQGDFNLVVVNPDQQQSQAVLFVVSVQSIQPAISQIQPAQVTVGQPTTLTVTGTGFQYGFTASVSTSQGVFNIAAAGLTFVSPTQVQVQVNMGPTPNPPYPATLMISDPGGYNASGTFTVIPATVGSVTISSILPVAPSAGPNNQTVTVNGSGFQSGLTVAVGFPGGGGTTLSGSQIQSVTATSFQMIITLGGAGAYTIKVNNPDGSQSNMFSLNVGSGTVAISSISPSAPTAGPNNQTVTVTGSGFQSGLTVAIGFPGGGGTTLSGSQIQAVTATSFQMIVTLGSAGPYTIKVNNSDGGQSNTFSFNVGSGTVAISSISPSAPTAGPNNQTVTVTGSGFQSGLTVAVGFPGGGGTTLSGSQIQSVTATSFQMIVTLGGAGAYTIKVNNPDGGQSNTFSFNVSSGTVAITSISPASPTAGPNNQTVTVNGSGFQSGLTVAVGFPGGGGTTLSGSQIQSVTATSFQMIITLGAAGAYTIKVNNPDGGQSNTFSFNVGSGSVAITSISPASPTAGPNNQTVTVNGSGFQSGLTVAVGFPGGGGATLSGSQIQSVTATSFQMIVTLGGVGAYTIKVNNPSGGQSNTFSFSVGSGTVAISSISPSSPTAGPNNQTVTANGSGFQAGLTVAVGFPGGGGTTLSGSQIQSVTANSFQMIITLGSAGAYSIKVNNPDGSQSNTFSFNASSGTVAISSISPSSPTAGPNNQTVTVNGSGFQSGLTVAVGFPGGGGTTLSGSQIQAVTATSFQMIITLGGAGAYTIKVNNPDGGQSNTFGFSVSAAVSTPSISSISPGTPTASASNQTVTVFGSQFQSGLTVAVGFPGGGGTTLSGSQIQSVTATSFQMIITLSGPGAWNIRVNNPDGGQSNTFGFSVSAAVSTPSISSISPGTPTASASNQTVTVFGSQFQSGLTVAVGFPGGGGTTLSGSQIQSVTATSFQMIITLSGPGAWNIRVNNPDGGQSNTFGFNVNAAVSTPSISSISPGTPTASGSNQTVTVSGSQFQSGLTVTVGFPGGGGTTLSGSQIQSVSASSFQMIITLGGAGAYTIKVNNPDGGHSNTFGFNVNAAVSTPSVSSISPGTPTASGSNQTVTVFGSQFQSGLTVSVGFPGGGGTTLSGSQIQSVTATSFQMIITLSGSGAWNIKVNNPDGGQSNTFGFNVNAAVSTPSISSISPGTPTASGSNQTVTVFGSQFQSGLTVSVGFPGGGGTTLSGSQIQSVTASSFQMVITLSGSGTWTIKVNNPDGGQSNTFSFSVNSAAPTISSISPANPTHSGSNQTITVFGSNFQAGLTVSVTFPGGGGTTLSGSQIQNVTSSSFQMIITFGSSGTWAIKANNPSGQSSSNFLFTVF